MSTRTPDTRNDTAVRANAPEVFARANGTEKLQLKIGGMSCSFCVASITKALGRMEGVREVNVNLAHEEALIAYEPAKITPTELQETQRDLGYTVRDARKVRIFEEEEAQLRQARNDFWLAAGFTAISFGMKRAMPGW